MLFSDCAFLDMANSIAAAIMAKNAIREFIKERVPVRIGVATGTFYRLSVSTKIADTTISECRFIGTAVVYAHEAEKCGEKGMRILLHPSAVEDLRQNWSREVRMLPLPE